MRGTLRWRHGAPGVRARVDAWWSADPPGGDARDPGAVPIDESAHRRVVRLDDASGGHVVKHYRSGTGPHPLRERAKAAIALGAAQREWRALHRLRRAGVLAPRPLGLARTTRGDALLVMEAIDAPTLWQLLARDPRGRRALLLDVADLVASLHAARLAHGDLHPGNVLVPDGRPVLVDVQRCRRARRGGERQLRDLGLLDYSLGQLGVSRGDRLRVLQRALGLDGVARAARRTGSRAALRAAERTRRRETRKRGRHGRAPAAGSRWRLDTGP